MCGFSSYTTEVKIRAYFSGMKGNTNPQHTRGRKEGGGEEVLWGKKLFPKDNIQEQLINNSSLQCEPSSALSPTCHTFKMSNSSDPPSAFLTFQM